MHTLRSAVALLTILPVRAGAAHVPARALPCYPLVGLLLGLLLAGAGTGLRWLFPNAVTAVLLVALWVGITGGLHLDGVADSCDALFAVSSPARRLAILHDVHHGTFGVVGLVLLLVGKVVVLGQISSPIPVLLAPVLGRWAMVYAATYPLARPDGMATRFVAGLTRGEIRAATLLTALCCLPGGLFGAGALALACLGAWLVVRLALARLGGVTGDILGLTCELVELVVLLVGVAERP
jgi:adenosylcobinamide-GDP ribazoletransferase